MTTQSLSFKPNLTFFEDHWKEYSLHCKIIHNNYVLYDVKNHPRNSFKTPQKSKYTLLSCDLWSLKCSSLTNHYTYVNNGQFCNSNKKISSSRKYIKLFKMEDFTEVQLIEPYHVHDSNEISFYKFKFIIFLQRHWYIISQLIDYEHLKLRNYGEILEPPVLCSGINILDPSIWI